MSISVPVISSMPINVVDVVVVGLIGLAGRSEVDIFVAPELVVVIVVVDEDDGTAGGGGVDICRKFESTIC